jgi:hypothetical protein
MRSRAPRLAAAATNGMMGRQTGNTQGAGEDAQWLT